MKEMPYHQLIPYLAELTIESLENDPETSRKICYTLLNEQQKKLRDGETNMFKLIVDNVKSIEETGTVGATIVADMRKHFQKPALVG